MIVYNIVIRIKQRYSYRLSISIDEVRAGMMIASLDHVGQVPNKSCLRVLSHSVQSPVKLWWKSMKVEVTDVWLLYYSDKYLNLNCRNEGINANIFQERRFCQLSDSGHFSLCSQGHC